MTLSLEACRALKAMGFPQGQWPQHVWARRLENGGVIRGAALAYWNAQAPSFKEVVACPDALDALDWLSTEECHPGWRYAWAHLEDGDNPPWSADFYRDGAYEPMPWSPENVPLFTSTSALILNIAEHWKAEVAA